MRKILNYLLKKIITPQDLAWLIENYSERWSDFSTNPLWHQKNASDAWEIYRRITEILDAKIKTKRRRSFTDVLSAEEVIELTKILEIEISNFPTRTTKIFRIKKILEKIKEEEDKEIRLSFND